MTLLMLLILLFAVWTGILIWGKLSGVQYVVGLMFLGFLYLLFGR